MANPTLIGNVTPYTGFTLAQIVERLLATFGLTEDSTTGRTVASTEEAAQARVFVRRAVSMLNGKFPSIWSIRETTGTWTAGDHSVACPSQVRSILYVLFNGIPLTPITRDDDLRIKTADLSAGVAGPVKTGGSVLLYRTTGITSANAIVLRLYDTPSEALSYAIGYNTIAPALTTDADPLPYMTQFQEWILAQARNLWAAELNDLATKSSSAADMRQIEDPLLKDAEAMIEAPSRLKWRFPNPAGKFQRGANRW